MCKLDLMCTFGAFLLESMTTTRQFLTELVLYLLDRPANDSDMLHYCSFCESTRVYKPKLGCEINLVMINFILNDCIHGNCLGLG